MARRPPLPAARPARPAARRPAWPLASLIGLSQRQAATDPDYCNANTRVGWPAGLLQSSLHTGLPGSKQTLPTLGLASVQKSQVSYPGSLLSELPGISSKNAVSSWKKFSLSQNSGRRCSRHPTHHTPSLRWRQANPASAYSSAAHLVCPVGWVANQRRCSRSPPTRGSRQFSADLPGFKRGECDGFHYCMFTAARCSAAATKYVNLAGNSQ